MRPMLRVFTTLFLANLCLRCCFRHSKQVCARRSGRCDGIRSFPGCLLSPDGFFPRKDVSRVVIFPDETFPRKTSWMVGLMFNCSWRWSLTERPYCVYLNGFTVNSPHCQFATLTKSSQVNMGLVGIQCYQVPVVSNIKDHREYL